MPDKIILFLLVGIAITGFLGGFTCGLLTGSTHTVELDRQILELQTQLNDPHHCLSVCVEEFEKMGC